MADSLIRFSLDPYGPDEAVIRASQVAAWEMTRGPCPALIVTLKCGAVFKHRDGNGSIGELAATVETAVTRYIEWQAETAMEVR